MWLSKVPMASFISIIIFSVASAEYINLANCPVEKTKVLSKKKNIYSEKSWDGKDLPLKIAVHKRTTKKYEMRIMELINNSGFKHNNSHRNRDYKIYTKWYDASRNISSNFVITKELFIIFSGFSLSEIDTIISKCLPKNQTK